MSSFTCCTANLVPTSAPRDFGMTHSVTLSTRVPGSMRAGASGVRVRVFLVLFRRVSDVSETRTATQPATATGSDETCRLVPAQLYRGPRASVNVRTTHTARGCEVARAKMVAFGHPNHHTRQPVGDGGTAQCLWHSAAGTRGTAPLSVLAGCG